MSPTKTTRTEGGNLRARAEERWRAKAGAFASENDTTERTRHLVHEVQVHQIELELQNDELQAALADLQVSRGHYADLYDHAPVGYLTLDHAGDIQNANFEGARLLGQERARLIGARLASFLSNDSRPTLDTALQQASASLSKQVFEVSISPSEGPALWVHVEVMFARDFGNTYHVVLVDMTQQRQTEQHLRDAQRMETVGRLAGGIAHDFNNILAVILNTAELTMDDVGADSSVHSGLAEIYKAATRAAVLTRQLLAFGRRQMLQPRVVDLNKIIGGMMDMMHRLLGETIVLTVQLAPALGRVMADPGQIEQILLNLAVNARDAMKSGGNLTIKTANIELDESSARHHDGAKPGPHVMLSVSDTGCGMDEKTCARVYEPFFTTKEIGRGTGLGLATVYGIVKQSGGAIRVESELGHGTTFTVMFPYEPSRVEQPVSTVVGEKQAAGTETILLVEDEEPVRALARLILTKAGYTVLAASNGGEALRLCEHHNGPLHLVLTDVIMPEMSGKELADRLQVRCRDLPVLFMSGYTEEAIFPHGVLDSGANFIGKPFTGAALTRTVRQILDRQSQVARG